MIDLYSWPYIMKKGLSVVIVGHVLASIMHILLLWSNASLIIEMHMMDLIDTNF